MRVAVDVPALADQGRQLDYLLPPAMGTDLLPGTIVRVPLHGRRVAAWVLATDVVPPAGVALQPIAKVTGWGPSPDVVELTSWGAWRWAGRRTALLRTASPLGAVRSLPPPVPAGTGPRPPGGEMASLAQEALAAREAVVRLPPAADPTAFLGAVAGAGPLLVVTPGVEMARLLARGLRREGATVATVPEGWARAAGGGVTVIGARAAAWAPAPDAAAIVVIDAHDDGLVEQRAPSWSAWVVAAERARRAAVPCILVSPCPLLEQLQWGRLLVPPRPDERRGWAPVEVVDRGGDDPRSGLLGERLVPILRSASGAARVVCVLNRKGRVRLSVCRVCGKPTVCEHCGAAVEATGGSLSCRRCGTVRPVVCQSCGSASLRAVRVGVSKLRDDIEALARLPVGEVTAEVERLPDTPVVVGTEAVLHRAADAGVPVGRVIFLDFDAELLAPRYRAGEEALALLARAARLVGGRSESGGGGRVLVQTRQPDHPVLDAAVRGDPGRVVEAELALRRELRLPPAVALAELSGDAGVVGAVVAGLGERPG
ncbi:MAG TPA: hypothetical protein VGI06_11160, partial [Acidimicrobiales bacterium]